MLFHVSEEPGIKHFHPRMPKDGGLPIVWAIGEDHLRNYLLPRDCPRITYYAGLNTSIHDKERFLGSSDNVVAIESVWYERVQKCKLYCYQMPTETFFCIDEYAGYFGSLVAVVPSAVDVIKNPIRELVKRGVELRIMSDIWSLHDAITVSTLQFSMIRMRNASPKTTKEGNSPVNHVE